MRVLLWRRYGCESSVAEAQLINPMLFWQQTTLPLLKHILNAQKFQVVSSRYIMTPAAPTK